MLKRSRKQVSLLAICGVVVLFWLVSWFSTDGRSASLTSTRGRLSSHARHTLVNRTCEPIRDVEGNTNRQHYVEFDGVVYPRHVSLYQNRSINFECLNANPSGVKKILFWNSFCDSASFSYGLGVSQPFVDNNCPATNCETFTDRSRIAESDLILVHMRDHIDPLPSPSRQRLANERWVFVLYESPVHADDYRIYDGRFDLASTYSLESDFPDFYSAGANLNWELNDNFDLESIERQLAAKPNFAALVVSNCNDRSRRLDYVDELAKHVPVDVFGKCGRECPTHLRDGRPADCKEIIGHEYKFYLAFENSVCDEYITEKFFAILSKPIIPVVLGGGFYDYYVPRSAYIDATEFATPKQLGDYLSYVSQNATAYASYFAWKRHVTFDAKRTALFAPICNMCIQLNLESYYGRREKERASQGLRRVSEYWSKASCPLPRVKSSGVFEF